MKLKTRNGRLEAIAQLRIQLGYQRDLTATILRACNFDGAAAKELDEVEKKLADSIRRLQAIGEKDV